MPTIKDLARMKGKVDALLSVGNSIQDEIDVEIGLFEDLIEENNRLDERVKKIEATLEALQAKFEEEPVLTKAYT